MPENKKPETVFVQVLDRPARKMIVKRGTKAPRRARSRSRRAG
jgi:hypothetical protein